jgi:hypothetical protein
MEEQVDKYKRVQQDRQEVSSPPLDNRDRAILKGGMVSQIWGLRNATAQLAERRGVFKEDLLLGTPTTRSFT